MEALTAEELMIPLDNYPHVPYWFTIRQAVAEIHHAALEVGGRTSLARAVLIFDEDYKLLGLVRRRDILKGLEPSNFFGKPNDEKMQYYDITVDPNLLEMSPDKLIHTIRERAETPVRDIMIPIKHAVNNDDHLLKVIYEMNQTQLSMMPVLKEGSVIGVIRTVEVMDAVAKILEID